MAGIHDIKTMFEQAVKGIQLKALRMKYADQKTGEQVFDLDIIKDGKEQTIEERIPAGWMVPQITKALVAAAEAIGAEVDMGAAQMLIDQRAADQAKIEPLPDIGPNIGPKDIKAALDMLEANDEMPPRPLQAVQSEMIPEIEHKGEKYELAHDGAPNTLFF